MARADKTGEGVSPDGRYLPALRWHLLTPAYDVVVRWTTRERRFKEQLLDIADLQPGERVLDVGAGTGTLLAAAHGRVGGLGLIGVDRDGRMLGRAAAKTSAAGANVQLHRADARALPLVDRSVDVVISSLFFHHLTSDVKRAVFAEIARVICPDGRFVVADWGKPRGPASRVGASFIRLLNGAEPTSD
ncbi:MAG: class I SAM-dependent methyltransferase, partial [Acidimicrobiales bacterium]